MKYKIIIPARLKSSRLPGKPLVMIDGIPMLQRTYERCTLSVEQEEIIVATDHSSIESFCLDNNIKVVMTSEECLTGTDRVAEAANDMDIDFAINVQGDEPLINPKDITLMIEAANNGPYHVYAGYAEITNENDFFNVSVPKVIVNENEELIYMSRAPIPFNKESKFITAWRQICVYAFSKEALNLFYSRSKKSKIENIEDIELLRFLEMGIKVKMIKLSSDSIAVDHPEDILKVENAIRANSK
jgi:3-deoxy-manno-octulosonate cytidylyltransferase (CMP-KDO synthetase)